MPRFTAENQEKLNEIYFHDSLFFDYTYSYEERTISFICTNGYVKKEYALQFNNVVYHEMIGCGFWGSNNCYIHWAGYSPCEDVSKKLSRLQAKSAEETKESSYLPKSRWNAGIKYVPMLFEFFTGDTLTILAEEIIVEVKEL